ncbi:fasciclin domain-containing protein [Sphingomonas lutea]|uniref:Fasciclin domain-containing protein n=1 Tax=Sphingomonas lutea TaxID=1045317 RepID=A0A7G9SJ46_9SPHN|nr:fasciclin domain-containing protein [Sphingomonas lutea]QNN67871.1 fasciclin domain-containing protein [Sphingomonas lutea]
MKPITSRAAFALAGAAALALGSAASARNPMVGGAAMYPARNIVQNAVNSKDHTTLVAAVKAAGLVDTLSGKGPFTVFAPTNAAFGKLPAGTVETLVKPENKATLTNILTYHVVPGRYTAAQIAALAARNRGTATLKTVQGENLRFRKNGAGWSVIDAKGNRSRITIANVMQSNGVIHVIDAVAMP